MQYIYAIHIYIYIYILNICYPAQYIRSVRSRPAQVFGPSPGGLWRNPGGLSASAGRSPAAWTAKFKLGRGPESGAALTKSKLTWKRWTDWLSHFFDKSRFWILRSTRLTVQNRPMITRHSSDAALNDNHTLQKMGLCTANLIWNWDPSIDDLDSSPQSPA